MHGYFRQSGATKTLFVIGLLLLAIAGVWVMQGRLSNLMALYRVEGAQGMALRIKDSLPIATPNVDWETASAASKGFDEAKLEALSTTMVEKGTHALIIVRDNRIVHEYYAPNQRPDSPYFIAAMGKLVTASMAVGLAVADDRIGVDDPLKSYIPSWLSDPQRNAITVRHILTHSSGIENVSFTREHEGWQQEYLENPDRRFKLAMDSAPVRFAPGSRYEYSGVGFYTLAYALGRVLMDQPESNARDLLRNRLMSPLGVPQHDWSISYGESYALDGMHLYAIGSGGAYTPRALARIGQLLVDRGIWEGSRLLPESFANAVLDFGRSPPDHSRDESNPAAGLGVWLNCDGYWPTVPADAAVAAGGGHQVLLMIPSLRLVAVRLGKPLGKDRWEGDYWSALYEHLLHPLIGTIEDAEFAAPPASCLQ